MRKKVELLENERIDDLLIDDYHIIQKKDCYCFTSDAVLLSNFAKAKKSDKVLDLCSGSGIVGILTSIKNKPQKAVLVEMQEELCEMAQRSILMNNMQQSVCVVNSKVQNAFEILNNEQFDVITCNPPYKTINNHKITEKQNIAVCKYELTLNFDELCNAVNKLLKFGGKFYFVHESNRLCEIFSTLTKYGLEPKVLQICFPKNKTESNVILVQAVKGGKSGLKIEKVYN